jgi:DNA-binding NarL/FixJ family response regulator
MLNPTMALNHYQEDLATLQRFNDVMSVLKTPGGRLTSAGIEFIQTALRFGLSQADIARRLEVSAATVSHHANS